jgi:hypothetical protein
VAPQERPLEPAIHNILTTAPVMVVPDGDAT